MSRAGRKKGVYSLDKVICFTCGKDFERYACQRSRFCGRACFHEYKKTLVGPLSPRWAGGPKPKVPKPRAKYWLGKKRPEFAKSIMGEKHPNWKGGHYDPQERAFRKQATYKEWRRQVFDRDDYTCQGCGIRGGYLIADHELPFAHFPDLRLEVLNGRTLCVPCHKKTPTYGGKMLTYTA